jgi:hypothetical protein
MRVIGMTVLVGGLVRVQVCMAVLTLVHVLVNVTMLVGMHVRVGVRMHEIAVPVLVFVGVGMSVIVSMLVWMAMRRVVAVAVLGVRHGPLLWSHCGWLRRYCSHR